MNESYQKEQLKLRRLSFSDGVAYALMVGLGETYLVAFALELGVSPKTAGLLAVLPLVFGSVFQLLSSYVFRRRVSARIWVLSCGFVQISSLVSLASLGYLSQTPITLPTILALFVISTCYWTAALAAGPVWNGWISELLEETRQANFFITRTRYAEAAILISLILAAIFLHVGKALVSSKDILISMLLIAASCRLISRIFLSAHPKDTPLRPCEPLLRQEPIWGWFRSRQVLVMLIFCFASSFAVQVSAPYFSPYMLRALSLDYLSYTFLIGIVFAARIAANLLILKIHKLFGAKLLLRLGAFGIIPIAWCWTLTDNYLHLVILQCLSGLVWSCHELGVSLYLLDSMKPKERSRLLSWVSVFNSVGMALGVSLALWIVGDRLMDQALYHRLFETSSLLRFLPFCIFLLWAPRNIPTRPLLMRVLGLRAQGQEILRPIL